MLNKAFLVIFFYCFSQASIAFAQSPKTDTIPSLPPKSEVKVDRDNTNWLSDTTNQKKKHSPKKATLYSLVLPGLGQVYNRQYYKVPIIAAAGILLVTQISSNNFDLKHANRNLETRSRNDQFPESTKKASPQLFEFDAYDPLNPANLNSVGNRTFTADQLRLVRDGYRRDRDFYVIVTALVYALNIVDAAVFAHLREFEVNDKLSLKLDPEIKLVSGAPAAGLCLSLNFIQKK